MDQVLAQLELQAKAEKYGKTVTMLPKKLDEEVAWLHLDQRMRRPGSWLVVRGSWWAGPPLPSGFGGIGPFHVHVNRSARSFVITACDERSFCQGSCSCCEATRRRRRRVLRRQSRLKPHRSSPTHRGRATPVSGDCRAVVSPRPMCPLRCSFRWLISYSNFRFKAVQRGFAQIASTSSRDLRAIHRRPRSGVPSPIM